jgi:hypothetical protein
VRGLTRIAALLQAVRTSERSIATGRARPEPYQKKRAEQDRAPRSACRNSTCCSSYGQECCLQNVRKHNTLSIIKITAIKHILFVAITCQQIQKPRQPKKRRSYSLPNRSIWIEYFFLRNKKKASANRSSRHLRSLYLLETACIVVMRPMRKSPSFVRGQDHSVHHISDNPVESR